MNLSARICSSFLLVAALIDPALAGSQVPSGKDVVSPEAYSSFDPVARGKSFEIAVVMKIRPGFHVNAREVTFDYLIPTDLKIDVPAGFKAGEIVYPKGTLHTFTFSKDKQLNVYTGSVILRLPVTVLPDAPLGAQHLQLKLHYQACSDEICLPPVTLPVDAAVNVTDNPGSARPAHSELFSK
jgi:DsbC/DsbD-like thiol-disulfide interchange protein